MKAIRTSDEEFGRLLTAIADDMVAATIHWRLYQHLAAAVTDFERELNEARGFWALTLNAHRDVALWRLGRLYDPKPGALGLPNFLFTVKEKLSTFDEQPFRERLAENAHVDSLASQVRRPTKAQVDEDVRRVNRSDGLVDAFIRLRNNHLGHRSSEAALGRLELPGLDVSDIADLLERACEIVNRYSQLYRAETYSVRRIGEDDYLGVLESIRAAHDAREAAIEKEIEQAAHRENL